MANIAFFLALLVAMTAAVVPSIVAADHVVGDSTGWIVPGSPSFYSEWAAKQTFAVGDTLVFNFLTGAHTVARTTKDGHDNCDLNAATNTMSTAPAKVTLDEAGEYYFICTVPGHCAVGQKLAVTVGASSSVVPSPAPSSSTAAPSEAQTAPPTASSPAPSEAPSAITPVASPAPSEAPSAITPVASPAPSEAPSAITPVASPAPSSVATPEASPSPSGSLTPTPEPEASPSPLGSDNPIAEPPASSASSLAATFYLAGISAAVALLY